MSDKQRVLFLCTHNSARSQMAEGLLRSLAGESCPAFPSNTQRVHWSFDDPSKGDLETFRRVRDEIHERLRAFARPLACNMSAIAPERRASHAETTRRLIAHANLEETDDAFVFTIDRMHASPAQLAR